MNHWKYKAYDASGAISEGYIDSRTPELAVLALRQRGLQAFELVTAHHSERRRDRTVEDKVDRLCRLRDAIENANAEDEQPVNDTGHRRAAAKARRTAASYYWWSAAAVVATAVALAVATVAAILLWR